MNIGPLVTLVVGLVMIYAAATGRAEALWDALTRGKQ